MDQSQHREHGSLVLSYLALRKSIGVIGIGLPFALAICGALHHQPLQDSVSQYYHTVGRNVFVGSLCAVAVFLWSYCGYERRDNVAASIASLTGLGVALFPTTPADPVGADKLIGILHFVFAGVFFLTLAYMSLKLFRLSDQPNPTPRKLARNRVYTVCGYTILISIGLIAAVSFLPETSPIRRIKPVFWLEAAAIVAFGLSWLTKGEAILADLPDQRESPAPPVAPRVPPNATDGVGND